MLNTPESSEELSVPTATLNNQSASGYLTTIGLEVHAQLLTESKMYCSCSASIAYAPPNSHVCPVCMGMPGTLPVINSEAVHKTLLTGLALSCTIPPLSKFDRKNYPYPDLMKGYQISQYDLPFCQDGFLDVEETDPRGNIKRTFRIGIIRAHLEEDTARLMHRTDPNGTPYSLMDVNRAGVPLMEVVSAPDIASPEEAELYLMKMRHLLRWLNVSTGNMEEGAFRCDANVSVRPVGQKEYGTKVEIKNMNSFKSVVAALKYEVLRQTAALKSGERIPQETRGWDDVRNITISQRTKEQAHDYRYFPEPDLPPLTFTPEQVETLRAELPELPDARRNRFATQYNLTPYDALQLASSKATADYFEQVVEGASDEHARTAATFVVNELPRLLGDEGGSIEGSSLKPAILRELVDLVAGGTINHGIAKSLLPELFKDGGSPKAIVSERGLAILRDESALEQAVDAAVAANPKAVADYLGGKESALGAFLGPIMRATSGQADSNTVREMLKRKLEEMRDK
ncbi:MAG: Asp-tRNA(Asn)/Glu-tRNA(Gln) amidotransferase subunit GatB [Chloroflexia bacterium]